MPENVGGACLNELKIYDKNINKCNYTVLSDLHYDTSEENQGRLWLSTTTWGYTNLNDEQIEYTSNAIGAQNATIFLAGPNGNTNSWSRFVIDLGKDVDIGQIRIAVGGNESRNPKKVTIYYINKFIDGTEENSTYTQNITKQNNSGLTKIGERNFDSNITNASWFNYMELKDIKTARYLLFEVDGYIDGGQAVINEIEVYNKYDEKCNYTVLPDLHYDISEENQGRWWLNTTTFGYTNLNDGQTAYTSNTVGGKNATIFLAGPSGNINSWARFIIDLGEEVILSNADIWIGGVEKRIPRTINIFTVDNFVNGTGENSTYSNNVAKKDNTELTLFSTKTFNTVQTTSQKYTFM